MTGSRGGGSGNGAREWCVTGVGPAIYKLQTGVCISFHGAGETKSPMLANLIFYWFIGLPVGWTLGFPGGLGARGIWAGLCLGLVLIGCTLLVLWRSKTRRLQAMPDAALSEAALT